MPARFRVALQGFSDLERDTLGMCFRLSPSRIPAYESVDDVSEADFVVADAEGPGIIGRLSKAQRLADTVFVGPQPVNGSLSHVRRPIDPILVVRELDALSAVRGAQPRRRAKAGASPPELTDDLESEPPPAPPITRPGDVGEPTRPYVRVTDPEEAPPADLEVREMFDLPDFVVSDEPAPPQGVAEETGSTPPDGVFEVDVPLEPIELSALDAAAPMASPPVSATAPAAQEASTQSASTPGVPAAPASARDVPGPHAAAALPASPAPEQHAESPEAAALWPDAKAQAKARARAAAARRRNATQLFSGGDSPPLEALVLDDSDIAAQYLGQLLEEIGFHAHLATTSTEALEVLTHQPITVAFLDLTLGESDELDGLDICQRIKHEPLALGGSPPLVVLVAGQARATDRVRATLAGSDGFMTKPFGKQEIVRVLESCGMTLLPTLTQPAGDRPPA